MLAVNSHDSSLPHAGATRSHLARFTALVFGYWVLQYALVPLHALAGLPAELFDPPGLSGWFPRAWELALVRPETLWAVRLGGAATAAAAMGGLGGTRVAAAACCCLTLHESVVRGFSHVNHAGVLMIVCAWVLAAHRALDPRRLRPDAPLAACAFVLLLSYTLVGAHRLSHGGPAMFTGPSMEIWMAQFAADPSYYGFGLGRWAADVPFATALLPVGFFAVTLLEVAALLAFTSRPFRRAFAALMIGFHVGTLCLMNILFLENLLLLPTLLLDRPGPAAGGEPAAATAEPG